MASNEAVLVKNAVSKLYLLQFITIGISTFSNERFQTCTVSFEAVCIIILIKESEYRHFFPNRKLYVLKYLFCILHKELMNGT